MKRALAAITVGLLGSSCGHDKTDGGGRYQLSVNDLPPGTPIYAAGRSIGVLDAHRRLEAVLPKGVYVSDGKGSIVAKVATPCGTTDLVIAPSKFATLESEKFERSMTEASSQYLELPPTTTLRTVWIDRTRAPSAKVTVGALALDPSSEVQGRIRMMWPGCEEGLRIRIDGREIGRLSAVPPEDQDLVIAVAPGCYRLREVAYTANTYGRGADDRVFERTQMFWTTTLTYFLDEAPRSISSREAGEMRRELRATECAPTRSRPSTATTRAHK